MKIYAEACLFRNSEITRDLGFLLCVFLCISKCLQKAYIKFNKKKSTFHSENISGENRVGNMCNNRSVYGDCNVFLQEL